MIIDIRLPSFHLPRKWPHPTRDWQRWFIVIPRLVHVEHNSVRVLILPGWHETRISLSRNHRVWRTVGCAT